MSIAKLIKQAKDLIPGGLGDKVPYTDFSKAKLDEGAKVELEHTSSKSIAKEIAKDHLVEDKNYYKKLKRIEGGKHADALGKNEPSQVNMSPDSSTSLVSQDVPIKTIQDALDSVLSELTDVEAQLQAIQSGDPNAPQPDPNVDLEEKQRKLTDLHRGLEKVLRQRQYALRDELLPAEQAQLADLDLLTRPAAASKHEQKSRAFVDGGELVDQATDGNKVGSIIDVDELRLTMFFEGLSDSLAKHGRYVERPLDFFAGMYERLRHKFEPPHKRAAYGQYPEFAVNAARNFLYRQMELVKEAFGNTTPIQPIGSVGGGGQMGQPAKIPDPREQAMSEVAMDPQRMQRRQDLIDEMLPNAETIALDPDGGIKLKMPDPIAQQAKAEKMKADIQNAKAQQFATANGAPQQQPGGPAGGGMSGGPVSPQPQAQRGQGGVGALLQSAMQGGSSGSDDQLADMGPTPSQKIGRRLGLPV